MKSRARLAGLLTCASLLPAALGAANPPAGGVSPGAPGTAWQGGPWVLPLPTVETNCPAGLPVSATALGCDSFRLTIEPPAGNAYAVRIAVEPSDAADDLDLYVYDPFGRLAESSAGSTGYEDVDLIVPSAGVYEVVVQGWLVTPGNTYAGTATLAALPAPPPGPPPASAETRPYDILVAPAPLGRDAGEPTLGVNENTGNVMYISGLETLRANFDDRTSPPLEDWRDVSFLTTSLISFDPILWTDQQTGRTFVSQLLFPAKQSAMAFTDDDGETWLPSQGSGINTGVDHQAVGGGPLPASVPPPPGGYPHAVYFCAQDLALAECAVSLDGGQTFGPGVPIYALHECGGLHGHPKVAPEGTVYVPNKSCGAGQGVVVSTDLGLTWDVREVGGSTPGEWDPSVATASDGTVYLGMADGDGHPRIAVSHDQGLTWWNLTDVGVEFGIQNTAFPVVVAGDPERAAFAFLGSSTPGNGAGDDPTWPGEWHLYVAHTYDGGATWTTVNATPGDPVQRGTICGGGIGCELGTRNLLDFMDITVDQAGRALVAFPDGCVGGCVIGAPNSRTAVASIARQASGARLYAAHDPAPAPPAAPRLVAAYDGAGAVALSWSTPVDNGSPLTAYRLYRRRAGATQELLFTLAPGVHQVVDRDPGAGAVYAIAADNGLGAGEQGPEVTPIPHGGPAPDPCRPPGVPVASGDGGDATPAQLDVESLAVAEPAFADGVDRLVFTFKLADLSSFLPGHAWYVLWNRALPGVDFDRNYVVLRATANGGTAFRYGKITPPNVNQAVDLGDADFGTLAPDGSVTIGVALDKVDQPQPGWDLGDLQMRTFVANVSGQPVTGASAADATAPAVYTLAGNAGCDANGAPVAVTDVAGTEEGRPVQIPVLANDSDPDGDPLQVVALGAPAHGKVVARKQGGVVGYKPDAGFVGLDSFSYTVGDGRGATATAMVSVTVEAR